MKFSALPTSLQRCSGRRSIRRKTPLAISPKTMITVLSMRKTPKCGGLIWCLEMPSKTPHTRTVIKTHGGYGKRATFQLAIHTVKVFIQSRARLAESFLDRLLVDIGQFQQKNSQLWIM